MLQLNWICFGSVFTYVHTYNIFYYSSKSDFFFTDDLSLTSYCTFIFADDNTQKTICMIMKRDAGKILQKKIWRTAEWWCYAASAFWDSRSMYEKNYRII